MQARWSKSEKHRAVELKQGSVVCRVTMRVVQRMSDFMKTVRGRWGATPAVSEAIYRWPGLVGQRREKSGKWRCFRQMNLFRGWKKQRCREDDWIKKKVKIAIFGPHLHLVSHMQTVKNNHHISETVEHWLDVWWREGIVE